MSLLMLKNSTQKNFWDIIKFQDEPITSPSHINQFILRKQIKKKI